MCAVLGVDMSVKCKLYDNQLVVAVMFFEKEHHQLRVTKQKVVPD